MRCVEAAAAVVVVFVVPMVMVSAVTEPALIATGLAGKNEMVPRLGLAVAASMMLPLKPFRDERLNVAVANEPAFTVAVGVGKLMEKSGVVPDEPAGVANPHFVTS
jgi:hypothetical protein